MDRRIKCLNGEWLFMPLYEAEAEAQTEAEFAEKFINAPHFESEKIRIPSSFKWKVNNSINYEPFDVFRYPEKWDEADCGVIAREIYIESKDKERVFLIFKGVLQKWKVYINEKLIYESNEGFITTEIDVTEHVKNKDTNSLVVWCGPFDTTETISGVKSLVPNGSWFGNMARGIWQDVFMEYRNQTYIEDAHINTSVRNRELKINISIYNRSKYPLEKVLVDIFDSKGKVMNICSELNNENQEWRVITIKQKWENTEYWSPDSPKLFKMVISIEKDGEVIDSICKTFGFREVWLDEHKFILNGNRINLKGDAWHYNGFAVQTKEFAYNYFKLCKENGVNFVRLHAMPYPDFYIEAADEVGMLIVDESAIYGSHKNMRADHPTYIENCKKHLEAFIKRDRNHPSVIIWSMQNEMRWVDGRDGYKLAMKELIKVIRECDNTRPISFDGDNRLVDYKDMEIVSMHYNIDGTIRDWNKEKPLAFGEHGKWHYISPQVCAGQGGEGAYLSFDNCMTALGQEEQHFNEYARKEEVTALCPFNISNYMLRSMPSEDVELYFSDLTSPGPKPKFINKHSLTINNGLISESPCYTANTSLEYIKKSFKAVTILPEDYNKCFYGGRKIVRGFNIYNDTEYQAESNLLIELFNELGVVVQKEYTQFIQKAGEKYHTEYILDAEKVNKKSRLMLRATLKHGKKEMDVYETEYFVYPKVSKIICNEKRVGYVGDLQEYEIISKLVTVEFIKSIDVGSISSIQVLILGSNNTFKLSEIQPILNDFVTNGGYLVILQQKDIAPGDVTLSGKRFCSAFINTPNHPIFDGLSDEDFTYWDSSNTNEQYCKYIVENAFNKPVAGDFKMLLQCGEGDFGWGGLLWSPLIEYTLGRGGLILSQLNINEFFKDLPIAALLLRNMFKYAQEYKTKNKYPVLLAADKQSKITGFIENIGIEYKALNNLEFNSLPIGSILVLDINTIRSEDIKKISFFVNNGGKALITQVSKKHEKLLTELLEEDVIVRNSEVYQLKKLDNILMDGISNFDTYNFEKVTYSPAAKDNIIIAKNSISFNGKISLYESVKNPWYTYFIKGCDTEYIKIGVCDMIMKEDIAAECYGAMKKLGKGEIIISNIELLKSDKVKRVYTTLLSNMGAAINTEILTYHKKETDMGIPYFMALEYDEKNFFLEEESYFTDSQYVLNNLGEGIYGWMKRVEKEKGFINIEGSRNKIYFLTLFIDSSSNHNPEKRAIGELPDSSIVPDLYMDINCPFKLYVNGKCYIDNRHSEDKDYKTLKIEDVILDKGINRVCLICYVEENDCKLNMCLKNKYGDSVEGIKYILTLD